MRQRLLTYITSIFFLLLVLSPPARIEAASPRLTEDQVKAAYIYNFAKFVKWPETAFINDHEPLRICIVGSDSLFEAMESLKDKTVQGRPLKISNPSSSDSVSECHILFIGQRGPKDFWNKREKKIIPNVLTIADFDSFISQEGIIEFIPENTKIRFAVNLNAANRAGLKLSSNLLKLAAFVKE